MRTFFFGGSCCSMNDGDGTPAPDGGSGDTPAPDAPDAPAAPPAA